VIVRADWQLVTAPAQSAVTIEEAKAHVRCTNTDSDGWFDLSMQAAVQMVEERCRRALFTQTWKLALSGWAGPIWLPRAAPLQSVTVQYYNGSNVLTTLSSSIYVVHSVGEPAEIHLADTQTWPVVYDRPDAIVVTYVAGHVSLATIPPLFKMAILFLVGHWWSNRESVVIGTISTEVQQSFADACELAGVVHGDRPYVAA
jgi:uncharacterized phiE125 gp8 family phage protein